MKFIEKSIFETVFIVNNCNEDNIFDNVINFLSNKYTETKNDGFAKLSDSLLHNKHIDFYLADDFNIVNDKNLFSLQDLIRKNWLYRYIASNDDLDVEKLKNILIEKYKMNHSLDNKCTEQKFFLLKYIDFIKDNSYISELRNILSNMLDSLNTAFIFLKQYLSLYNLCDDFIKLFEDSDSKTKLIEVNKDKDDKKLVDTSVSYQDTIRLLKSEKHDLELKLLHAKENILSDLVKELMDAKNSYPLGELYLLKNENLSDRVTGVINNFFISLNQFGLKLVKDKQVGQEIVITEDNKGKFEPINTDEILIGESVNVKYPGFRFENATIIKPIVNKITKGEE